MDYYFSTDPRVAPYVKVFSLGHILFLVGCVLTVFLFIRSGKAIREHRDTWRKVFFWIILFQQVFLMYGWYLLVSEDLLKEALPLEMCRISSILTLVFLLTQDQRFMDVVFYFSIFALCSLFYPKNVYHFLHVNGIGFMINHLMTVLTPIFGVVAYGWRPTWKSFFRAAGVFTVYLPTVILVNHFTGGNYFYLVDRPFLGSLSPWLFDVLAYVVTVGGFALVTWLITSLVRRTEKQTV